MEAVADLFPGYFALVMATGIISTATFLLENEVADLGAAAGNQSDRLVHSLLRRQT